MVHIDKLSEREAMIGDRKSTARWRIWRALQKMPYGGDVRLPIPQPDIPAFSPDAGRLTDEDYMHTVADWLLRLGSHLEYYAGIADEVKIERDRLVIQRDEVRKYIAPLIAQLAAETVA